MRLTHQSTTKGHTITMTDHIETTDGHDVTDAQAGHQAPGYSDEKRSLINRLHRVEGQVRAIAKMVEDDQYCIDIITQISAANSALKSAQLVLLDDHLAHCVATAAKEGGDVAQTKLKEASVAITRIVKS